MSASPLDDLLSDALAALGTKPAPRKRGKTPSISDFARRERWTRTRCLALYHTDSGTLLGNFAEYRHPRDSTARWLEREDGLTSVDGIEAVSGPQWVTFPDSESERLHRLEEEWEMVVDLFFPSLGVSAPAIRVWTIVSHIGIHRVELAEATTFHSPSRSIAITLPARLNVLPELSRDCKVAIKEELDRPDEPPAEPDHEPQLGS